MAVFGASGGPIAELDIPAVFFGHVSILGTTLGDAADFARFLDVVEREGLQPVVDSVTALSDVAAAHTRIEARRHFGKLVLVNR